jgi:hypothetical protein
MDDRGKDETRGRPLQFRLAGALGVMAAVSVVCAMLRWMNVEPKTGAIILLVLAVSVVAAILLVVAIAQSASGEDE